MRTLSAAQIIQVWEVGQKQHPVDQGLTLLSVACPEKTVDELAALPIGVRDSYLLSLRELTLGPQLEGFTTCPQCGERLEFQFQAEDIRLEAQSDYQVAPYTIEVEGIEVQFRLPTSQDLAAIAHCQAEQEADTLLWQRCILQASDNGVSVTRDALSPSVIDQVAEQMVTVDPQAEVLLPLICSACQHQWHSLFDILSFFWKELDAQAKRLLREVHALAQFYGWREADILAMSALRRQHYLELIADG